jgi:hypothetical protein
MKRLLTLLVLTLLVTACASRGTPAPTLVPTPTTPNMRIDVWVDNPTPVLGSDVVVHFNLLNEGVPINGLAMSAEWQQGGHKQLCNTQVQFEVGQCAIHVGDMEPGVYVPITVTTEYIGWTFYGYTGFTPQ